MDLSIYAAATDTIAIGGASDLDGGNLAVAGASITMDGTFTSHGGNATLDAGPQAICLPVHDSPKPPPERITLSLAVLRAARRCLLLATGAGKADAIAAALAEPSRHVPASLLRRERLTVIADDAAAPTS